MYNFRILLFLISFSGFFKGFGQLTKLDLNSTSAIVNWEILSKDQIANPNSLFQLGYNTESWKKATVPGTIFASYVKQGLEPDPNFGDNIYNVTKELYNKDFWYRTELTVPNNLTGNKIWLNFEGVNRDADIYFNGTFLGKIEGIVQRGKYNITSLVHASGSNTLAVLVYLPVIPLNCSAMPSYVASNSWDWQPAIPGLNSGVTDDVYITTSNEILINDPWIRTTSTSVSNAVLNISADIQNVSMTPVSGVLVGTINPGNVQFSKNITIPANSTEKLETTVNVGNPKLWWPNGYGDPNLYTCDLKFTVNNVSSDEKNVTFGIKKYSYTKVDDVFFLYINGKKIFVKGGNWGMSEYMLRCAKNEYDTKIRLHKEMNYNMIRNWVGSTTDNEFYEACDKYGIMVWDDFWLITTYINWPRNFNVFENNVIEKIKRNRNHPSIAMWCGANEMTPPENDYDPMYRAAISQYDGNDRWYQPNSREVGMSGSGPWNAYNPQDYYNSAPSMPGGPSSYGMRSELGTAVFVNYDSFKKFMPEGNLWPKNQMWEKHFFGDTYAPVAKSNDYFNKVENYYGTSKGIEEFCKKSQLLNIQVNKAMYEGWVHNMNDDASGLLVWMSQSSYPSMIWQTYDYYYDLTGAYWGAKSGCEPVHILKVPNTDIVEVINTSGQTMNDLIAKYEIFNLDGTLQFSAQTNISSLTFDSKATNIFSGEVIDKSNIDPVYVERLTLSDNTNKIISHNSYWATKAGDNNYNFINTLLPTEVSVSQNAEQVGDETIFTATITNNSNETAFANRILLTNPATKESILPAFIDKSYFTLFPGESSVVKVAVKTNILNGISPVVTATPYNDLVYKPIENLALYKKTTTSSTEGSHFGSSAVDGSYSTRWSSNYSDPQWLYVDLEHIYSINRIKITWEGARASDYEIQVSNDAVNWTAIQKVTGNSALVNEFDNLSHTARYIRIYGKTRATGWGYSIYELEVYGEQNTLGNNKHDIKLADQPYPNPFNTKINIPLKLQNGEEFEIKVQNVLGKTIDHTKAINNAENSIYEWSLKSNGQTLSPGMYFFTIQTNKSYQTFKLLKH